MKIDFSHIIAALLSLVGLVGPGVVAHLSASQVTTASQILGGLLALLGTMAALVAPSVAPSVNAASVKRAAVRAACAVSGVLLAVVLVGCLTTAQAQVLVADGQALESCVIGEALSGNFSAPSLALKCGAPAGFSMLAFVATLIKQMGPAPSVVATVGGSSVTLPSPRADVLAALAKVH